MFMNGKISVIIPIYNAETSLKRCLDSVVNQTYQNLQIILIDDGSKDASSTICDEYAQKDSRIEVVHQINAGVGAARNVGLSLVRGEYIGFVDADDFIELDMYESLLKTLLDYKVDIAACSFFDERLNRVKEGDSGMVVCRRVKKQIALFLRDREFNNYLWNKLFRASLFDAVQFPELKLCEDLSVLIQLYLHSGKIAQLEQPKYHYTDNPASLTNSGPKLEGTYAQYCAIRHLQNCVGRRSKYIRRLINKRLQKKAIQVVSHSNLCEETAEILKMREEAIFTIKRGEFTPLPLDYMLKYLFIRYSLKHYDKVYRKVKKKK